MGVEELPSSGNKFTGSRMIVPGVGLNTYRVQKNDKFSIRRNPFANSINASPTPTPSITPTNTPTPTITPTNTPTPSITPTTSPIPLNQFVFDAIGLDSITFSFILTSIGGYVDWGDGNTSSITTLSNSKSHTYSTTYTGQITINYYGNVTFLNYSNTSPVTSSVIEIDTQEIGNLSLLTSLTISYGRLVGQMSDITSLSSLTTLNVKYDYTTSPNLNELPQSIEALYIGNAGYTTMTGDISVLSGTSIQNVVIWGSNTVSGNVSTLPTSVTQISVVGSNTLSGNTSDFNFPNLTNVFIYGNNTITGDVINLPNTITTLYIDGNNSLYGNLSDIPYSINSLTITTNGVLVGDLSDLPRAGYSILQLKGNSTSLSADTATIPIISGSTFNVDIRGTLTGDLINIFNNITDFPNCIFSLDSNNATSVTLSYTPATINWGSIQLNYFVLYTPLSNNLSSNEINNLLIDMDSYSGGVTWTSCGSTIAIYLNGTRTATSDAAVTSLNGKGVTVTISP